MNEYRFTIVQKEDPDIPTLYIEITRKSTHNLVDMNMILLLSLLV